MKIIFIKMASKLYIQLLNICYHPHIMFPYPDTFSYILEKETPKYDNIYSLKSVRENAKKFITEENSIKLFNSYDDEIYNRKKIQENFIKDIYKNKYINELQNALYKSSPFMWALYNIYYD